jgi:hypothetical protein
MLLAGEAGAKASSYRLSEIGNFLDNTFRARRDGQTSCFRLRIGSDESRGGWGAGSRSNWTGAGMAAGPTLSFFGKGADVNQPRIK